MGWRLQGEVGYPYHQMGSSPWNASPPAAPIISTDAVPDATIVAVAVVFAVLLVCGVGIAIYCHCKLHLTREVGHRLGASDHAGGMPPTAGAPAAAVGLTLLQNKNNGITPRAASAVIQVLESEVLNCVATGNVSGVLSNANAVAALRQQPVLFARPGTPAERAPPRAAPDAPPIDPPPPAPPAELVPPRARSRRRAGTPLPVGLASQPVPSQRPASAQWDSPGGHPAATRRLRTTRAGSPRSPPPIFVHRPRPREAPPFSY